MKTIYQPINTEPIMEKKDYLSAKKAHEIAVNANHIDEVIECIKSSCENGRFCTTFKYMSKGDIEILQGLGYEVIKVGGLIRVSWES